MQTVNVYKIREANELLGSHVNGMLTRVYEGINLLCNLYVCVCGGGVER